MEQVTEIISKKIISLEEGVCVGYIFNPMFDFQTLSIYGYLICDESEEVIKFLDIRNILANEEFIIIKNSNMLSFGENMQNNSPIGKQIIASNGINLGKIKEINLNGKKINKLITEKGEINPNNISCWEGEYLIFSEKKIKRHKKYNFPKIDKKIRKGLKFKKIKIFIMRKTLKFSFLIKQIFQQKK